MTKKSLSKLLSVILAIAICATTVLGCLITANAADVACYSWSEGSADSETFKTATIELTLTAPDALSKGFTTAVFEFEGSDWLLSAITVKGGVRFDGGTFSADDYSAVVYDGTQDVSLDTTPADREVNAEDIALSSVTLELALTFANDGAAEQGVYYSVTISGLQMGTSYDAFLYTASAVTGTVSAGCEHSEIAVKGNPVNTDDVNGYTVYTDYYCAVCGADKAELDEAGVTCGYQLVPTAESITGGTTITWSEQGAYDDDLASPEFEGTTQTGDKDNPIIIDTVEELYSLAMRTKWEDTLNKYYKLADGIDNVVLQSDEAAYDIMKLSSSEKVKEHFSSGSWYSWGISNLSTNCAFAGHFDGNGATVYGLYANNAQAAGLFPFVYYTDKVTYTEITMIYSGNVSISNINVTNSYMYGTTRMGFIAGSTFSVDNANCVTAAGITGYNGDWYLNVDKCSVYNSYIHSTTSGNNSVIMNGVMVGYIGNFYNHIASYDGAKCALIENSMVYGNTNLTVDGYTISLTGNYGRGSYLTAEKKKIEVLYDSLLVLGTSPYLSTANGNNTPSSHSSHKNRFSNVYTDASTTVDYSGENASYDITYPTSAISSVTADAVLGFGAVSACPNLEWGSIWSYGTDGNYPSLVSGTPNIIYWDGTTAAEHPTEKDEQGNYIISTAAELHYIAQRNGTKVAETTGNTYKIADGIDAIILQPYDVIVKAGGVERLMNLSSSDDVYDYFKNSGVTFTPWVVNSDETPFNGSFDGNGVKIYGLYADGTQTNVGLFRAVDAGSPDENGDNPTGNTFKNFAIKNSYLETKRRMGAIAALSREKTYTGGTANGIIHIENCEVSNCYMYCNSTNTLERTINGEKVNTYNVGISENGVLTGALHSTSDVLQIKNCLVYGNYAKFKQWKNKNTSGYYHVNEQTEDGYQLDDIYIMGATGNNLDIAGTGYKFELHSSIVLGVPWNTIFTLEGGYYTNVYTDQTKYAADKLAQYNCGYVTSDDIIGTQAKTKMPNLGWDKDWYTNIGSYPTLKALDKASVKTTSNGAFGLTAYNTAYNNDGSLDFNFYFNAQTGYDYKLYVGKTDSKSGYTTFLAVSPVEVTDSAILEQLGENAMVATIPNLSSRDINTVWVPTLVATNGAVTEWGKSEKIALADYANGVLSDKAVYAEGTSAEIKLADKKVAAALLNYADAATTALTTPNDQPVAKTKVVYYNGFGKGVQPTNGKGTADEPIIIETAENLLWILKEGKATEKQYYKVADNIKAFILQPKNAVDAAGGLDELMSLDEQGVMRWFDDPNKTVTYTDNGGYSAASNTRVVNVNGKDVTWTNWDITTNSSSTPFMGHFDGNGVAIYGFYKNGGNPSLFGVLKGATIKNLNVKSSYIRGYSGGIIADSSTGGTSYTNTIENCVIQNCCTISYRQSGKTDMTVINTTVYNSMGAVAGGMTSNLMKISNCLVSNMVAYNFGFDRTDGATSVAGQTVKDTYYYDTQGNINTSGWAIEGNTLAWLGGAPNSTNEYSNSIVLGVEPYSSTKQNYQNGTVKDDAFSSIYTDQTSVNISWPNADPSKDPFVHSYAENRVKQITDLESLKGATAMTTCPALDWEAGWMITAGYPQPVQSGMTATGGKTLYWNGNKDPDLTNEEHEGTDQSGTADNPIIIDSAEELAYIASAGPTVTQFYNADGTTAEDKFKGPKYYRMADGIDRIVLQNSTYSEILALNGSEQTRAYFEGETGVSVSQLKKWAGVVGWQAAKADDTIKDSFCGVFDGNGVEIYGIYTNDGGYGALFGDMDVGSAVKNVTVKNSYIHVSEAEANNDARVAAIVAHVDNALAMSNDDKLSGTITIENCRVQGCHIGTPDLNEKKNNSTTYSFGTVNCGLLAANLDRAKLVVNNCVVSDSESYYNYLKLYGDKEMVPSKLIGNISAVANYTLSNSVIVGADPGVNKSNAYDSNFNNVYTDQATSFTTVTTVDRSTLKGSNAADIVAALNEANNTDTPVWYVGAAGDYPSFEKADAIPNWLQSEYDSFISTKFNTFDNVEGVDSGVFGLNTVSLNLKANPYMSFIFAFKDEYKTNRADISVKFKYTDFYGKEKATEWIAVPAYDGNDISDVNGWTNGAVNGRYHTYQFKDLPVSALANDIKVYAKYDGENQIKETLLATVSAAGLANNFIKASKEMPCNYYNACVDASKALLFYIKTLKTRYSELA